MSENKTEKKNTVERPPIIAVMGHIDHGKSALLDYIRKSNIVAGEAGGITQHISAYEATHNGKKITFLDTPGHEAFTAMRLRGASIADIAILVVSAEEGPKPQTIEALNSIKKAGIPFVIAINKIDKPEANIEKTKTQLMEKEIYVEGYGGDIPWAAISAKTGQGVSELLDTVLLIAEMEELKGDKNLPAEGFVLESNMNPKTGVSATLIITNGTLRNGDFVVSENNCAHVRKISDFMGNPVDEASFSSPVQVIGFKEVPAVGSVFTSYHSKKEAEKEATCFVPNEIKEANIPANFDAKKTTIPIILKADVLGTIEALKYEIEKITNDRVNLKIIHTGVGNITENDIKMAGSNENTIVAGFNVKVEKSATDLAEKEEIHVGTFNIIYKLTEWLEEQIKLKTPKIRTEKTTGRAKILKLFSQNKNKQVVGGEVLEGSISAKSKIKILRRDFEIERGTILEMQIHKTKTNEVKEGDQFGMMIEAKKEIAVGDVLEAFVVVEE